MTDDVFRGPEQPSDAAPLAQWYPKTRKLLEYWHSMRPAPGLLPGRQHFDPLDIPGLMPNIFMLDRFPDSGRLRYRLVGTRVVEAMLRDLTGKWYDEAHPGVLNHAMHNYTQERTLRG